MHPLITKDSKEPQKEPQVDFKEKKLKEEATDFQKSGLSTGPLNCLLWPHSDLWQNWVIGSSLSALGQ